MGYDGGEGVLYDVVGVEDVGGEEFGRGFGGVVGGVEDGEDYGEGVV